ncbi:MAG: hypothetical protein ACYCZ7_01980 [Minisyncoccota bacterium]
MRLLNAKILITAAILTPLFTFAQEATTTAEQSTETSVLQQQIDQLINSRKALIPTPEESVANSIINHLDIKTNPQNPGPRETIRIKIESYLTDLNKATIGWSVNGKLMERGIGKTAFLFQNGASGETTRLTISIVTNSGISISKDLSWSPVGITVLWEADTYTPPFYKGKALPSPQSMIRAIAIPDSAGSRGALDAGNLVYVWKKDGTVAGEASGYGKNFFSFLAPKPYGESRVSVQVSSINDTIKSEMKVSLPLAQPFILFYENHPLLGVWRNRALNTEFNLAKKEFSISAEPYFFSNETGETSTLLYNWSLNGKAVQNIGRAITLRNEAGEKGDSALTLAMRGIKKTFQSGSQSLLIHFTTPESARPTF